MQYDLVRNEENNRINVFFDQLIVGNNFVVVFKIPIFFINYIIYPIYLIIAPLQAALYSAYYFTSDAQPIETGHFLRMMTTEPCPWYSKLYWWTAFAFTFFAILTNATFFGAEFSNILKKVSQSLSILIFHYANITQRDVHVLRSFFAGIILTSFAFAATLILNRNACMSLAELFQAPWLLWPLTWATAIVHTIGRIVTGINFFLNEDDYPLKESDMLNDYSIIYQCCFRLTQLINIVLALLSGWVFYLYTIHSLSEIGINTSRGWRVCLGVWGMLGNVILYLNCAVTILHVTYRYFVAHQIVFEQNGLGYTQLAKLMFLPFLAIISDFSGANMAAVAKEVSHERFLQYVIWYGAFVINLKTLIGASIPKHQELTKKCEPFPGFFQAVDPVSRLELSQHNPLTASI